MRRILLFLALATLFSACTSTGDSTPSPTRSEPGSPVGETGQDEPGAAPETAPRIAAVGDMVCSAPPNNGARPTSDDRRYRRGFCQYGKVSDLVVEGDYEKFLPLGDIQYYRGTLEYFRKYYDPTFGRVKDITAPVPGNHESYSIDEKGRPYAGYRAYYGKKAHWNRAGGAYSYDLGSWHIVGLNSEWCHPFNWAVVDGKWVKIDPWPHGTPWGCQEGDPQYEWLVRDLKANADASCTLAYFHHPSYFWAGYAGGPETLVHPGYTQSRPLYRVLYDHGTDVVLTGHHHYYQRMVPMDPSATADPDYGFTQFIVGTGGDTLGPIPAEDKQIDTVAVANNTAFGILEMTLLDGAYDFQFVPAAGNPGRWHHSEKLGYDVFLNGGGDMPIDEGSGTCHGAPPAS